MRNILSNYGGKTAGVTSDLHDKMNSRHRRKYCFTQRIPGIDPLCKISGVFPRSGLSSVPSRPTSKSGSTRLALVCAATVGAVHFVSFMWLHAPDKPISILRDWDTQRQKKKKVMLHVSYCIRCTFFWGLYGVFGKPHHSCLLVHVDVILSLPAWTDGWSVYTGSPKPLIYFTLAFPLDGISVMSHPIDVWVLPVSSGEFFHPGCRPHSASSQIWVLTISAIMYGPHLLDMKPSVRMVAWSSPCILWYLAQSVLSVHVQANAVKLESPLERPCSGCPSAWCRSLCYSCTGLRCSAQPHVAALSDAWVIPTTDWDRLRRDLTWPFKHLNFGHLTM